MRCFFITHPEVVIDPAAPVEEWGLSSRGRARAAHLPELLQGQVARVVSSAERKATETAAVAAAALAVQTVVEPGLGEMDRRATGYLPPNEFETVVDAFFADPSRSVRGWERAVDAQRRVEDAVRRSVRGEGAVPTAFIAHGGVGGLLLASLTGTPISRTLDQPGLGSFFTFDAVSWTALSGWSALPGE